MILTDRLALRALEPTDADFMYDVENDSESWRYSDIVAPLSRKMLRDYALDYDADPFRAGQLRLIITDRQNGVPVGIADLYDISQRHRRAFAGIYIRPDFRGNGYAEEAVDALCRYASETLLLHQVAARIDASNRISINVFRKCGFKVIAVLPDWTALPDDGYSDLLLLSKML